MATALVEDAHAVLPEAKITVLVRQGNDVFFKDHPFVHQVLVWDKTKAKYSALLKMIATVRSNKFDCVLNIHRFAASGLITALSGALLRIGFHNNPLSFCYSHKVQHSTSSGLHEVDRNAALLRSITDKPIKSKPKLYPTLEHKRGIEKYAAVKFITMSPQSVWFTKTAPRNFWIDLIRAHKDWTIYLLGSGADREVCSAIILEANVPHAINLSGELSLMESAALMAKATMNFTNDSAPMHLCSALNAPVTAVYCSTIPDFGFGPLSDHSVICETSEPLACRPCGLHGHAQCPKGHFSCGQLDWRKIVIAS